MYRLHLDIGVEWVLACVAPETIAPHPNFRVTSPSAPELLALLSEYRLNDFDRYRGEASEATRADLRIVDDVHSLLTEGSEGNHVHALSAVATATDRPLGIRAAAALFAATELAAADRLDDALSVLGSPLADGSRDVARPADRLISAALRQQLVLRYVEMDRREEAYSTAKAVEEIARLARDRVPRLRTSKGYGGGSRSAYRDAFATLYSHARSARAVLGPWQDKAWVSLVRSRPSRPDERSYRAIAHAGEALGRRVFEDELSWLRQRYVFVSRDPVIDPVRQALLHAELTGDVGATRHWRELLGRLHLLEYSPGEERCAAKALRLLRQSDSQESLADTTQWIRAAAPGQVLREAAIGLVSNLTVRKLTRADLTVVVAAAEVLESSHLQAAIEYCDTLRNGSRGWSRLSNESPATWAVTEVAWSSVARLLAGSGADGHVAHRLYEYVLVRPEPRQIALRAALRVAEALEWSEVPTDRQAQWLEWALTRADDEERDLAFAVLDGLDGVSAHVPHCGRPRGLELAARVVWEQQHGIEVTPEDLANSAAACSADMQRTKAAAARGQFSFGALNGAELAAVLATTSGTSPLYDELVDLFLDERVLSTYKAPALDQLAHRSSSVPVELRPRLLSAATALAFEPDRQASDLFETRPLPVVPEAIRFLVAMRSLPDDETLRSIMSLVRVPNVAARIEAAKCLGFATDVYRKEWCVLLLLQLAYDPDVVVRARVGRLLGSALSATDGLRSLIVERVVELLSSPGLLTPLLTLRGMNSAALDNEQIRRAVGAAQTNEWRSVRNAALALLDSTS